MLVLKLLKNMKIYYCFLIIVFLLFSCSKTKQGELPEIPVDMDQNSSLALSEIAEAITATELEFTDKSLINPGNIQRIIVSANHVIIAELSKVLVFNKKGKFIRPIGSIGQGPGEYKYIKTLAMDESSNRLFILSSSPSKIICYDLNGNFLKESTLPFQFTDINYVNDQLILVGEDWRGNEAKEFVSQAELYRLNDNLQVIDNRTIRNIFVGPTPFGTLFRDTDFILNGNRSLYLYYGDFFYPALNGGNSAIRALCDTLYRFEDNQLVPELKLKFKNNNTNKFIHLFNIYRSSRYIFSYYRNKQNENSYCFCYDTKTGKGYHMQDGFTDDINLIEEPVRIRPFASDTEWFYYLHTHMKPDDIEEPNPTLYIGKLNN